MKIALAVSVPHVLHVQYQSRQYDIDKLLGTHGIFKVSEDWEDPAFHHQREYET